MRKIKYLLFAGALLLAACEGKEKEPEPAVFTVANPGTVTAEAQTVSVKVNCDLPWTAALKESASWAKLSQTADAAVLALSFNGEDSERSLTLSVTAGKQEKTVTLTQNGLSSVVKPLSLSLSGTAPGRIDIRFKQEWEAVTDAPWLSLAREQASGGNFRLIVTPTDGNENVGPRSSTLVITSGGETVIVPVSQEQTDVVYPADEILRANAFAGDHSYALETNVAYSVEIPSDVKWVEVVETKALNAGELVLHFSENISGKTRETPITLRYGSVSKKLTVRQTYKHAILNSSAPGVYGFLSADFTYEAGSSQWAWYSSAASEEFRILCPARRSVLRISDLPAQMLLGDTFPVTILTQEGIYPGESVSADVTVLDQRDGLVFLAGSATGKGIIVKTEDL